MENKQGADWVSLNVKLHTRLRLKRLEAALSLDQGKVVTHDEAINWLISLGERTRTSKELA